MYELLGSIKLKKNMPSQALFIYNKILEELDEFGKNRTLPILEDIDLIRFNLCDALRQLGRLEEAKEIYHIIIDNLCQIEFDNPR